jgi:O-antigen ligase
MGVVGFLLAATFWPGLAGAAEASRWASLCILVPIALFFVRVRLTFVHLVGGFLFGWAVLSLMWTPVWYDGVAALMQLTILVGAVLIGAGGKVDGLWKGLGLGLLVSSALCIFQALGFHPVIDAGQAPAGLFVNQDVLAEITAVVFIALVFERLWLAVGLLPALILTGCRSALIAVFVVGGIAGWRKWRWRILYGLPLLVGGVLLTATKWSNGDSPRIDMWRDTLAGLTTWGSGIGSFYSAFPKYATLTSDLYQPAHAHNDLLELAFELGIIPAVIAALLVLALAWRANFKEQMLLIALGIMSMVGFPLHSPSTVFVFGIVAGCAARNWSVLRAFKFGGGYNLHKGRERPDYAAAGTSGEIISIQSRF